MNHLNNLSKKLQMKLNLLIICQYLKLQLETNQLKNSQKVKILLREAKDQRVDAIEYFQHTVFMKRYNFSILYY